MSDKTFESIAGTANEDAAERRTPGAEPAPSDAAAADAPAAPCIDKDGLRVVVECCACLTAALALDVKSAIVNVLHDEVQELRARLEEPADPRLAKKDRECEALADLQRLWTTNSLVAAIGGMDPLATFGLLAALGEYSADCDRNSERRLVKAHLGLNRRCANEALASRK
jgi:hypothetical protein